MTTDAIPAKIIENTEPKASNFASGIQFRRELFEARPAVLSDKPSTINMAAFDGNNPPRIVDKGDSSSEHREEGRDTPEKGGITKQTRETLEKLAGEIGKKGSIVSDADVERLLKGELKEEDLLLNRLRATLKQAIGDGNDIKPALDIINKKLAEQGSPYQLKAEKFKNGGDEGYNIKLVDKQTGKQKDGFLLTTMEQRKIENIAEQLSTGKFISKEDTEKLVNGEKQFSETPFGKLMESVQEAVKNGQDPKKIIDALNKELEKSKSKYKIETEDTGDGMRLRLVDKESGAVSDKIKVPFEKN